MRPTVCIPTLVLAFVVLAGEPSPVTGEPCPFATVQLDYRDGSITTPSAALDTSDTAARVTFDRAAGTLSLYAIQGGRSSTFVHVTERFMLIGIPAGTQVNATLEFQVEGQAASTCGGGGCGMEFKASLLAAGVTENADASIAGPGSPTRPLDATLAIPITFIGGEPLEAEFRIDYATGPGAGSEEAEGRGVWSIRGLPEGVQAVRCLETTPARAHTWGALKLRYR